jgi:N-acetylglucosamine transport system permease protein
MSQPSLIGGKKRSSPEFIIFVIAGMAPAVIISFWLHIYPVFQGLYISLFRWSGLSPKKNFVGLENYRKLLSDSIVWLSLGHDLYIVLFKSLITISMALFFSIVLFYVSKRKQKIFQGIFFFPNILSVAIVGIIFTFVYNPSIGILNTVLEQLNLEHLTRPWLGDPNTALNAVLFPSIWAAVGYQMLLISAGMAALPGVYFEVCLLEGASKFQQFIYIIFPLLRNVLKTCLSLLVINTLNQTFIFIRVMTNGGPNHSTEVLGTYMYYQAFENFKFGYGTSIAVINFFLALILTFAVTKLLKKEGLEYA